VITSGSETAMDYFPRAAARGPQLVGRAPRAWLVIGLLWPLGRAPPTDVVVGLGSWRVSIADKSVELLGNLRSF
jgi:hypothetical protein